MIILKSLSNILSPHVRITLSQVLTVLAADTLLFIHGLCIGFPVILVSALSVSNAEKNATVNNNGNNFNLTEDDISWVGSINMLFIALANLFTGVIVDLVGYKRIMYITNSILLKACLILKFCNAFWQILIALSLCGFAGGLIEASNPRYVSHIARPNLRGILLASTALARTLGAFTMFIAASLLNWQHIAVIVSTLPVISVCLTFFVPESPVWYLRKNEELKAQKSLAWVRGWTSLENTQIEFLELKQYVTTSLKQNVSPQENSKSWIAWKEKFCKQSFIWPFCLVIAAMVIQNYTALIAITVYSVEIFATFQIPINKHHAPVLLGTFDITGYTLGSLLVHYLGKRILNFVSLISSGICLTLLGVYAYLNKIEYLTINDVATTETAALNNTWIPLCLLLSLSFLNCCGIQGLIWILLGEVFSADTQAVGVALSSALFNVFSFSVLKLSLSLISTLTLPGYFWFTGCAGFIGTIVLYFMLPETEGKSLQEIADHFSGVKKLDNKVRRKKEIVTHPVTEIQISHV